MIATMTYGVIAGGFSSSREVNCVILSKACKLTVDERSYTMEYLYSMLILQRRLFTPLVKAKTKKARMNMTFSVLLASPHMYSHWSPWGRMGRLAYSTSLQERVLSDNLSPCRLNCTILSMLFDFSLCLSTPRERHSMGLMLVLINSCLLLFFGTYTWRMYIR